MGNKHRRLESLVALCFVFGVTSARSDETAPLNDQALECKHWFIDGGGTIRTTDYRLRDTSDKMRQEFLINWEHHTWPAVKRVQAREFDHPMVMPDIDFTLQRWPNHMDAIRALITYDTSGGNMKGRVPTDCYLLHAREFAPDDYDVVFASAFYHQRKHQRDRARVEYEEALRLNPDLTEAHYNLGLLFAEMSNYDKAREHAIAAYERGYPLPGLRKQLERAGQWKESGGVPSP